MILAMGLASMAFTIVKECSQYPYFFQCFEHEGMLHFIECFFCIYRNNHVILDFKSVDMVNDIY
uniref:Uncharacterized protein n=1 Tax=Sciurus vulgaris TaxID=55149 RepID=A0A8D2DFC4_SCIVU